MKYKLFIATFFVSVSCLVGAPTDNNDQAIREMVYSSYEASVEKLKANDFDYLTKDLDVIYETIYEFILEAHHFLEENEDLVDELDKVSDSVYECVDDDLFVAVEHYENLTMQLSQALDESPRTPTCFKDLQIYFDDIKAELRKRIQSNETFEKVESYLEDIDEELENLITPDILSDDDDSVSELVDYYIENMAAAKEEQKSQSEIEELSAKTLSDMKEELDRYMVYLKEDGILNKEALEDAVNEYKKIKDSCQQMERDLYSNTAMMQTLTLTDIANIERFATAKIYILDSENNKIQLDCEDHVPYIGAKPTETVMSFSMDGDKLNFVLKGKDENGLKYKRKIIAEGFNQSVTTVIEVIDYEHESSADNFIFEFASGEET